MRGISQGTCKVIQTFIIHRVLNVSLAILITQLLCVDKTPSPEYLCIQQNSHCLDSFKHSRMSATPYVLGLYVKSLTQKKSYKEKNKLQTVLVLCSIPYTIMKPRMYLY